MNENGPFVFQGMGTVKSRRCCRSSSLHQAGNMLDQKNKQGLASRGKSSRNKYFTMTSSETTQTHPSTRQGSGLSPPCLYESSIHKRSLSGERTKVKAFYQNLNLDTHPVVTHLQNEQNQRLEGMEQRMNKIRKSAQEEAERRKFAHLFRAQSEDRLQAEKLLKEASMALHHIQNKKRMKKSCDQNYVLNSEESSPVDIKASMSSLNSIDNDKGDIIPVCIMPDKRSQVDLSHGKQYKSTTHQPLMKLLQPIESFHLSGLVFWLVLPFLLPVLILLHLIRHLSANSDRHNHKKN